MNWMAARRSGGEFVIMWDDVTYSNGQCCQSGYSLKTGVRRTRDQLSWLGLSADREAYWSSYLEEGKEAAEKLGYRLPIQKGIEPTIHGFVRTMPGDTVPYSAIYDPGLMAMWVIGESKERIDGYYTGEDFLGTSAFYDDVCYRLGIRPPVRSYIRCVQRQNRTEKESKSTGSISVGELRDAGYEPWQIISTLRECDRISRANKLAASIVPDGVLDPALPNKWLEYKGDIEKIIENVDYYKVHDCSDELSQWGEEAIANNLRRQMEVMSQ